MTSARPLPARRLTAFAGLALLAAAALPAQAQEFPHRTITLVVPAPPGGGLDGTARLLAKQMTLAWNQPVIVENQAGADGLIATRRVAAAAADGYTMLLQIPSLLLAKYNAKDLTFDPGTSLVAVSELGRTPSAISVSSKLPVHSVKELVDYCNKQPAPCTWGYGQQLSYLYGKRLFAVSGIKDSTPVPYKGTAPVITDLMGGHISIGITSIAAPLPYHQQGGLRILAVNVEKRAAEVPEVPNFREAGLNVPTRGSWYGLFVPRNTPAPVVATIEKAVTALAKDKEAGTVMRALGAEPVFGTSHEFSTSVAEEQVFLDDMVKQYSLK
ncbi:MAG: tripartite tricarboxylate transporter substrate binding protein [Pseudomonadota bacterium]